MKDKTIIVRMNGCSINHAVFLAGNTLQFMPHLTGEDKPCQRAIQHQTTLESIKDGRVVVYGGAVAVINYGKKERTPHRVCRFLSRLLGEKVTKVTIPL